MYDEHVVQPASERDAVDVREWHDDVDRYFRLYDVLQRRRVQRQQRPAYRPATSLDVGVIAGLLRHRRCSPSCAFAGRRCGTRMMLYIVQPFKV